MTVDAVVIPDVALTVDAIMAVGATMDVDATMDGELPCLAAETAAPAFSGSSACFAAVEITIAADAITTAAATIAAGSLSFFCCVAEITDVDAADFFSPKKGRGLFPLPFLVLFFGLFLLLFLIFQTFQIYLIKSISINDKFLFFFRFHNSIPLKNFFYI